MFNKNARELQNQINLLTEQLAFVREHRDQTVSNQAQLNGLVVEELQHKLANAEERYTYLTEKRAQVIERQTQLVAIKEASELLMVERAAIGEIKSAIKTARQEGVVLGESRYKEGYADGVSDGVRKLHDLTSASDERVYELAKSILGKDYPTTPTPIIVTPGSHDVTGFVPDQISKAK